ncbi:MAG: choice-of-anchor P family protein, partial [Actinomycetota bacterium]|nr:choice-of-anchor P family protein [Actinomycetota bacterium]
MSPTRTTGTRPLQARARALAVAMIVGGIGGLVLTATPATADVDTVSGAAYAASVNTTLLGQIVPPTPPGVAGTATEGGDPDFDTGLVSALPISVPGVLSVGVLNARTVGGNVEGEDPDASVTSFAEAANVVVGLGAITIDAVTAQCTSDDSGSTGTVQIVSGQAGGNPLVQSPAAGTVIELPGIARIVLNEQIRNDEPGVGTSIIVNALHIELFPGIGGLPAVADIIIGHVECAAFGPNVLVTTTVPTTAPPTTA